MLSKGFNTGALKLDVFQAGQQKVPADWLAKYQDEVKSDLEQMRTEYAAMVSKKQVAQAQPRKKEDVHLRSNKRIQILMQTQ